MFHVKHDARDADERLFTGLSEHLGYASDAELEAARRGQAAELKVRYQGSRQDCVPCSLSFLADWHRVPMPAGDAWGLGLEPVDGGYDPREALKAFRRCTGRPFFFVRHMQNLRAILHSRPLMVGIRDYWLAGGDDHCMVLLSKTEGGWLLLNWSDPERPDFVEEPDSVRFAFAAGIGHGPLGWRQTLKNIIENTLYGKNVV